MNKTPEWVKNPDNVTLGITKSPITGCLLRCPYYFAMKLANGRLRERYLANGNISPIQTESPGYYMSKLVDSLDPFYPRFWSERLLQIQQIKKPTGIFLCIMGEWAGDWIPREWQDEMFATIRLCPQHRFYLLTKQPQNLIKFSPFPDNCWVGVSCANQEMTDRAIGFLRSIQAKVHFISFEPLLEAVKEPSCDYLPGFNFYCLDWVIIGALTGKKAEIMELAKQYPELTPLPLSKGKWSLQPRVEWVEEIVRAADKAGIPVFLKDNLKPLILSHAQDKDAYWAEHILDKGGLLRQEMPG